MFLDFVMIAAGLVILVLAGDALVKGAVNLSLRLGVPALIVGLTVVAFGTSAPELLVSVEAVLGNAPALALGNVVGSNTANILLVLGVPALITAVPVSRDLMHDFIVMMAATFAFILLAFLGPFGWPHGLVLLLGLTLMLWNSYARAKSHRLSAQLLVDDETLARELEEYGAVTGIAISAEPFVRALRQELIQVAEEVDAAFPENAHAEIVDGQLILKRPAPPEVLAAVKQLDAKINERLIPTSIVDVLIDAERWLGHAAHGA